MANATQGTADGTEIEIPRGRLQGAAMLFVGLWALMFGGICALIAIKSSSAGVGFGVIGGIVSVFGLGAIATGGRSLFTGAPRFRATSDGVWFGGGSLVPWTAVNQVFEGAVSARSHGVQLREKRVSFTFHRHATLLRAPITCWFALPFSAGHIDIAVYNSASAAVLLVAQIDALRNRVARPTGEPV